MDQGGWVPVALLETAVWGAELATSLAGMETRGHIYVVEDWLWDEPPRSASECRRAEISPRSSAISSRRAPTDWASDAAPSAVGCEGAAGAGRAGTEALDGSGDRRGDAGGFALAG